MSLHTTTMMVRYVVNADASFMDELRLIPFDKRKNDPRIIELVRSLKTQWSQGTKIERLATLGWNEGDSCQLFSELIENLPQIRAEYSQQLRIHGNPPELDDKDLEKFEKAVRDERKAMRK